MQLEKPPADKPHESSSIETSKARIAWPWLLLHWGIILNLLIEIGYASYVLFVVLAPEGGGGPLWSRAGTVEMDLMMRRRLYATEAWIAIAGLSVYLAITEIGPRMWRHHARSQ